MNTRDRRTRQEYALLLCGEYFRDHLETCGGIGEERMKKREGLRDLCFDALGEPSLAGADKIRARYERLTEGTNGTPEQAGA